MDRFINFLFPNGFFICGIFVTCVLMGFACYEDTSADIEFIKRHMTTDCAIDATNRFLANYDDAITRAQIRKISTECEHKTAQLEGFTKWKTNPNGSAK